MADIELVIKIPEEYYKSIKDDAKKFLSKGMKVPSLYEIVIKGTQLPKGHGNLIDADELCDYFRDNRSKLYTHKDLQIVIDRQTPIIEADKGEEYEPDDWDSLANAERDH